jgi:hypothetical protein
MLGFCFYIKSRDDGYNRQKQHSNFSNSWYASNSRRPITAVKVNNMNPNKCLDDSNSRDANKCMDAKNAGNTSRRKDVSNNRESLATAGSPGTSTAVRT